MIRRNANKRLCWLLACVAAGVAFLAPPQIDTIDAKVRLAVTRSMLWHGCIAIEPPAAHPVLAPRGVHGLHYGVYAIGQSLVLMPLELGATGLVESMRAAGWRAGEATTEYVKDACIAGVYYVGINLLLALALFKLQRKLGLASRTGALGTLALLLCTQWLVWGRSMQEETLAALLLCAAALAGVGAAGDGRLARGALWFGACLGLLANVRYNAVFAAAGLCVWIGVALGDARRRLIFLACAAASLAPWLALGAWYNHARFGNFARSGYQMAMADGNLGGWAFASGDFFGLLLGADWGLLFFWAPLALAVAAWRGRARWGLAALGLALLAHVLFLSGVYRWARPEGCVGPRFVCHHLIVMGPFMWLGAVRAWRSRRWARPIVATLLACSFMVQLACAALSGELENMQRRARAAAGLETTPDHVLPLRLLNVARLASGDLLEYSYPAELGQPSTDQLSPESFHVAARPNLTPWRVSGGIRARSHLPAWAAPAAWGAWLVFGAVFAFCLRRVARPKP